MLLFCQNCGKRNVKGRNVSHSNVRTPRFFKANLQKVWIETGGKRVRMVLCSKCVRKLRNASKEQDNRESSKIASQA